MLADRHDSVSTEEQLRRSRVKFAGWAQGVARCSFSCTGCARPPPSQPRVPGSDELHPLAAEADLEGETVREVRNDKSTHELAGHTPKPGQTRSH